MSAKTDIGMMGAYGAVNDSGSNVNRWDDLLRNVIYCWRVLGLVADVVVDGEKKVGRYRKI